MWPNSKSQSILALPRTPWSPPTSYLHPDLAKGKDAIRVYSHRICPGSRGKHAIHSQSLSVCPPGRMVALVTKLKWHQAAWSQQWEADSNSISTVTQAYSKSLHTLIHTSSQSSYEMILFSQFWKRKLTIFPRFTYKSVRGGNGIGSSINQQIG